MRDETSNTYSAEATNASHRVLIVDDEPAILFAYRKLIEKEGIAVDICECLDQAALHIATRTYLAVIADLRLAGSDNKDGLEVIRMIRSTQPLAKVILSTGYGSEEIEHKVRSMGITHYFEKPVRPAVIMEALCSFYPIDDDQEWSDRSDPQ